MTDTIVHEHPVWRERANFIIAARMVDTRPEPRWYWEQLWARQTAANRFEICCIPFFVYDLALGDEVETEDTVTKKYVLSKVVAPSGRYPFRAWFSAPAAREKTIEEIRGVGGLIEERWPGSKLVAIDAANHEEAQAVADLLHEKQQLGLLTYETGRTK